MLTYQQRKRFPWVRQHPEESFPLYRCYRWVPRKKKRQGSQAGVGANHRAHIPNGDRDHVQSLLDHRRQSPRLVQTVSMADVNALILGVYGTLLHVFEQCLNGLFPSLGRLHGHQMPLVIHVEHWFDIEQVPHNRLAGGKAPAPAELAQILPL